MQRRSNAAGLSPRAARCRDIGLSLPLAGAVPTQIEVADLAQAFATGRIEAMITSPSTGVSSKSWDYLSYFHHTQAWIPKNVVVVNKAVFEGLSSAAQQAVLSAAAKAEARGWDMSRAETDEKIAILKKNGITIVTPSASLMGSLREIGTTMSAEWAKKAGEEGKIYCPHYLGGGIGLLASAHLLAAIGGPGILEIDCNPNSLREQLAEPFPSVTDGMFELPQTPGLGIEPGLEDLAPHRTL